MFQAIRGFLARRWLPSVALVAVLALLAYLGYVNWQTSRESAPPEAQKLSAAVTETAPQKGLPAPPTATATAAQQATRPVPQRLLTPPPGPGTMADVEASDIFLGYLFTGPNGEIEWVQQSMRLRDTNGHDLKSITVPILPGAFDAHVPDIIGPAVEVSDGTVTLPVALSANGGFSPVTITYRVPFDLFTKQSWTVPTFTLHGLWVVFTLQATYLSIQSRDLQRTPQLDAMTQGISWSSNAPVRAGTVLSWTIVPSDPKHYPNVTGAPAAPRNCISPTGQPLCKASGG